MFNIRIMRLWTGGRKRALVPSGFVVVAIAPASCFSSLTIPSFAAASAARTFSSSGFIGRGI